MAASQRVSLLVLDCIAFEMECFLRIPSQFHGSTAYDAILWTFDFIAFEEFIKSNFFDFRNWNIGDEWEQRCESNLTLIFIVFCGLEEMIALGGRVAPGMTSF